MTEDELKLICSGWDACSDHCDHGMLHKRHSNCNDHCHVNKGVYNAKCRLPTAEELVYFKLLEAQ